MNGNDGSSIFRFGDENYECVIQPIQKLPSIKGFTCYYNNIIFKYSLELLIKPRGEAI